MKSQEAKIPDFVPDDVFFFVWFVGSVRNCFMLASLFCTEQNTALGGGFNGTLLLP